MKETNDIEKYILNQNQKIEYFSKNVPDLFTVLHKYSIQSNG